MLRLDAPRKRLHSGAPWWLMRDGLGSAPAVVPTEADVAIVGGGITGALVADALSEAGLRVVVVDRRLPASGSTAVSTALIQYELDTELLELIEMIGESDAARAYQLAAAAVKTLGEIAASLPGSCGFAKRTSLYLAASAGDTTRLLDEAEARDRLGLDVEFWTEAEVRGKYDLPSYGALRTDVAAVLDPVLLTRALLARAESRGARVMPWTTALSVAEQGAKRSLLTDRGALLVEHVVLACGYEIPPCIEPSVTELHGTYALITEPMRDFGSIGENVLVWESRRPYTYLRSVDDRWMVGGMDVPDAGDFHRDQELPRRTRWLEEELCRLQPSADFTTAYSWAGTFGATSDGLPVIGTVPEMERVFYALGYGGNGITFSVVAAQILRDLCLGSPNEDARVFRPDR